MVAVRFIKQWKNYNPGDLAGFSEGMADDLVRSGFAVFADSKGKAIADPIVSPDPPGYSLPTKAPTKKPAPLTRPPVKRKG